MLLYTTFELSFPSTQPFLKTGIKISHIIHMCVTLQQTNWDWPYYNLLCQFKNLFKTYYNSES